MHTIYLRINLYHTCVTLFENAFTEIDCPQQHKSRGSWTNAIYLLLRKTVCINSSSAASSKPTLKPHLHAFLADYTQHRTRKAC